MKTLLLSAFLLFTSLGSAFSQDDAEGCKDHAILTRMPTYYITTCSHSYNQAEIVIGSTDGEQLRKTIEGTVSSMQYNQKDDSEGKLPSWFQIVKNYENALVKVGGKKVFSDGGAATFQVAGNGKEIWIALELNTSDGDGVNVYNFYAKVIEMEAMKQEIQATDIFEKLNTAGSIALYINFETGKAVIKAESQKIIDQVSEMLNANPSLSISIEGHTDNVGAPAANKTLSEDRAKAVMSALIAKGIDRARVSATGHGQEKPVADNKTSEGRAKNRRVEIVRK